MHITVYVSSQSPIHHAIPQSHAQIESYLLRSGCSIVACRRKGHGLDHAVPCQTAQAMVNVAKSAVHRPWEPQLPGLQCDEPRATSPTIGSTQRGAVARQAQGHAPQRTRTFPDAHRRRPRPDPAGMEQLLPAGGREGRLEGLDGWMRRRMRCMIWRQWKRPRTRRREN